MPKRDFKRELAHLYRPSAREVVAVDVREMSFLMVEGRGDPNTSPAYAQAVEALFSISYALRFAVKRGPSGLDYGVMPLEGLWWADDMDSFVSDRRSDWRWTMMIMQPDVVDDALVEAVTAEVDAKKDLIALPRVRFERFAEGPCAQTMHVGPFSTEGPTIERVHTFIQESGWERDGKHHEIYLSDIRRAAPANWKTVIRQPMRRSGPGGAVKDDGAHG
jgi:hypothetical protein